MRPYIDNPLSTPRSILLVAQLTPPSPLVGAHRPAALAKYLALRGHEVTLLTSVASGTGGIPGARRVVRTRDLLSSRLNWRRGHFEALQGRRQATYGEASRVAQIVVPDLSLVGWIPFALPRALGLCGREHFDCVITTSPPSSTHLLGRALQLAGTPWIADLRDGWTFDAPRPPWPTRIQDAVDAILEQGTLARADSVVAVTEPIAADLERRLGRAVATITNGFDPDERPADSAPALDAGRHSLVHTGRLNVVGRSPHEFFDGLHEYLRRRPDGARRLEVVLAGPVSVDQERLLADPRLDGLVRSLGNLERPVALALQRQADTLLVLAEGNEARPARSIATGKLFEYLGAGRPVLVLGTDSEAARIVAEAGAGTAVRGDDAGEIASALERLADHGLPVPTGAVDGYSWPVLAERWEREIEAAVARRGLIPSAPVRA
jgi:glycosyltransferase involved in cell wall biosynthesis